MFIQVGKLTINTDQIVYVEEHDYQGVAMLTVTFTHGLPKKLVGEEAAEFKEKLAKVTTDTVIHSHITFQVPKTKGLTDRLAAYVGKIK